MGALADAGRWHRERLGGGGRRRVPLRQAAANNGCGAYYDHPEHGTSCAGGCCVSPGESDVPRLQVRCWLSLVAHPGPQALWCQLPALVPTFDDASHIGSSGFCDATVHAGLRRGASSFFFCAAYLYLGTSVASRGGLFSGGAVFCCWFAHAGVPTTSSKRRGLAIGC